MSQPPPWDNGQSEGQPSDPGQPSPWPSGNQPPSWPTGGQPLYPGPGYTYGYGPRPGSVTFQVPNGVTVSTVKWTALSGYGSTAEWIVHG